MRADTSDVAFRLLLALGELWEGLNRAGIDPSARGLHITQEYLGGYTRYCAGPGSHPRLIFEWNESSRHLRIIRCEPWSGAEATISATVAFVRNEARAHGISDIVDRTLVAACKEPIKPARKTILPTALQSNPALAARRV
ncbi:MAG: hypothetical protein KatS3mg062_0257 [Tepidiforma sp.]|nr:MAG: hypothetical protein KatS3mg062_0257 [Tepidiforma sp.]